MAYCFEIYLFEEKQEIADLMEKFEQNPCPAMGKTNGVKT